MTFTNTDTGAECDSCSTVVGRSWRAKANHVCPRRVADPFAKWCESATCRKQLTPHDGESPSTFKRRRFCGRACAMTHTRSRTAERTTP